MINQSKYYLEESKNNFKNASKVYSNYKSEISTAANYLLSGIIVNSAIHTLREQGMISYFFKHECYSPKSFLSDLTKLSNAASTGILLYCAKHVFIDNSTHQGNNTLSSVIELGHSIKDTTIELGGGIKSLIDGFENATYSAIYKIAEYTGYIDDVENGEGEFRIMQEVDFDMDKVENDVSMMGKNEYDSHEA